MVEPPSVVTIGSETLSDVELVAATLLVGPAVGAVGTLASIELR